MVMKILAIKSKGTQAKKINIVNGENNDSTKRESKSSEQKPDKTVLDASLPQSKLNDKELLKTKVKDLDVD